MKPLRSGQNGGQTLNVDDRFSYLDELPEVIRSDDNRLEKKRLGSCAGSWIRTDSRDRTSLGRV